MVNRAGIWNAQFTIQDSLLALSLIGYEYSLIFCFSRLFFMNKLRDSLSYERFTFIYPLFTAGSDSLQTDEVVSLACAGDVGDV